MAQTLSTMFSILSSSAPATSGPNSSPITRRIFFFPPEKKNLPWRCNASKKPSFFDQILDYIEGGPKLRKWYGAPDLLPKDGSVAAEHDDADVEEARDAVLVTDGDSDIGQMVILSLIVKRTRVKALVKDKRAALEAFGTYVESLVGDANSKIFLRKALRGVRAIICPNEGFLSKVGSLKGVEHVVLLSQLSVYKGADGIQALMTSNARKLAEQDESTLMTSGIPYTIIRVGSLQNTPGGTQGFCFEEGCAARGNLSKEDAAFICVEALESVPETALVIEVVNGEEKVSDWKQHFTGLMQKQGQLQG
uniref:NAD(P)-binding domain-containing protein n=3 Tax=Opuntia streptacantha TaxID=393608 RepID=A0A7C9E4Y5_OPUST